MSYLPTAEAPPKPAVFLTMPMYGNPCPGAARAMYQYAGRNLVVHVSEPSASLLAHAFNMSVCAARNAASEGHQIDYVAMLHNDVEVVPPTRPDEKLWLNILIDELESTGADIVSAVIAIKDQRGITSTAVAGDDQWNPLFRLTMKQVMALPETFSNADLGHPDRALLVNTGCWVARAGAWLGEFPGYTIRDRLVCKEVQTAEGVRRLWHPEVVPEDWGASLWLHARGMKVMATRKVKLNHVGNFRFGNDSPWGEFDFDRDLNSDAAEALTRRLTEGVK